MDDILDNEWPDFPDEGKFDWSLSLKQIEKKYTPAPLIAPVYRFGKKKGEDLSNEIGRRKKFVEELERQMAMRKKNNNNG